MKRLVIAAFGLALMAVPLANCGGGSSKDDCGDIAKKICEKFQSCGLLNQAGITVGQCTDILEQSAAQDGMSDEQCRQEWESFDGMSCQQILM